MGNKVLYGSIFVLLFVFSVHSFTSIGQDVGRHIKTGQVIWDTKSVPKTNLFSYTEPEHEFINHHWLSEVMLFFVFSISGFAGLIIFKAIVILISYWLLFNSIREKKFWAVAVSFLLSIFVFIERTDVRPEIFSFLIFSFYLFSIFKAKYENNFKYLWYLPIAQLFWVNLHIYFFIGPFLLLAYLFDNFIAKKENLKNLILITFLVVGSNVLNPNWLNGALLPFKILNDYGYSIVENQNILFLSKFFNFNISIFIFKLTAVLLAVGLIFTAKKFKERIFEIIISIFFIFAGYKMLRNLPLFALSAFPVFSIIFSDFKIKKHYSLDRFFKVLLLGILAILIVLVVSNKFYNLTNSPKVFGLSVPNEFERAVNFVQKNNIKGPMFNNFDIGGYLIWKLYPEQKVFVDNRPEAYSVDFFSKIYKPMQEDKKKWTEFSDNYGINYVFFAHTDITPWGQQLVRNLIASKEWKLVYVNEAVLIFLKNNKENSRLISQFELNNNNAGEYIESVIKDSNISEVDSRIIMARVSYNLNWGEAALKFSDDVLALDNKNKQAHLIKGLAHAYYLDEENQKRAAENLEKAIKLGLKKSEYYTILGVVYMNLGRLESAEVAFKEAIKLDKNNEQAKQFLAEYFSK